MIVKDKVETETEYKSQETIRQWQRLALTQYISWCCWWDRLSPSAAEQAFYEELEMASEEGDNSDGEPTVKVKMNDICREITGTSKVSTSGPPMRKPGGRKRSHDDGDDDDGNDNDMQGRDNCDATATPPPKAKAKGRERVRSAQKPSGYCSGSLRTVDLLKARADLARDVKKAVADLTSRKSVYGIFKKKVENIDAEKRDLLVNCDPEEFLKKMDAEHVGPMKALDASMAKLPPKDVEDKKAFRATDA